MKRTRPILFLLAIMGLSPHLGGQQKQDDAKLAARMEKLVTVHAEIVGQSYCRADDEAFVTNLSLRLRFANASTNTVILSRKVESPTNVRAARNAEAASRGDFLYAPDVHFALNKLPPDAPSFGTAPSPELFVILAPGGSFETVVKTSVVGITDTAEPRKRNGLLAKGSYVLQIGVHTWPYDWPDFSGKTDSQELKKRWAKYGDLAIGPVFPTLRRSRFPSNLKLRIVRDN